MKFNVTHSTTYYYSEAVPICHNEVHLAPRDHRTQTCLNHRLQVEPAPQRIDSRIDYFGNKVGLFSIQESHQQLAVTSHSLVQVVELKPPDAAKTPPWEDVRDRFALGQPPWWLEARQFVHPSPYVPIFRVLREYAGPSFPAGQHWLAGLLHLTSRIFKDFKYDSTATTVNTPVAAVFEARRGVCQDFAHLQIACLRSIGLPARYVSGYLLNTPPPGKPRLIGADASHAWVSAFCPEVGWIDFDPTNNKVPGAEHITIGWGRDYSDVCPVKGVLVGGGQHSIRVAVDVAPLE